MKRITLINTILFVVLVPIYLLGQTSSASNVKPSGKVQPKIMVIPFTKEGEDIRTILEDDINKRIAITKIKEAFDERGFTTVDFTAKLKAAKENQLLTSDNQTDWKTQILQMSGADIYIQAEIDVVSGPYNPECGKTSSKVTLVLTGYEISSGNSLSNKVGESRYSCGDVGRLTSEAVKSIAEDFLRVMQMKFDDIVENGVEIVLDFTLDQNSVITFDDEVGSDALPLTDALAIWVEEISYKNIWTDQLNTSSKKTFLIRIPLKDPETNQNYNANKFSLNIYKYLKTMNINCKRMTSGNTIYVTIQ